VFYDVGLQGGYLTCYIRMLLTYLRSFLPWYLVVVTSNPAVPLMSTAVHDEEVRESWRLASSAIRVELILNAILRRL
jgi:hypothetical protein